MQFLQYLESDSPHGSYLVTGYRGMGKTSFVNKVINEHTENRKNKTHEGKRKVKKINLSFSQKNLNKEDILKQILDSLIFYLESCDDTIKMKKEISYSRLFRLFIWALSGILLVVLSPVLLEIGRKWPDAYTFSWNTFISSALFSTLAWVSLAASLLTLFLTFLFRLLRLGKKLYLEKKAKAPSLPNEPLAEDIYLRLQGLKMRSNAVLTEEDNLNSSTFFPNFPLSIFSRKSRNYPMMRGKDIESDLIKIIDDFEKTELIFVFDELDKVDVSIDWNESNPEISSSQSYNRSREQKETIVSILASLKFFMSQARAKFVFIAGREMFDAALADIADRQNYLGSIFHHVIYVDSFLKDTPLAHNTGLTQRVEDYLERVLFNDYPADILSRYSVPTDDGVFLRRYFFFLKENYLEEKLLDMEEILKVIFSLQMFIIYVTYRSNGSPKKMTKIIEEHIVKRDDAERYNFKTLVVSCIEPYKKKNDSAYQCLELTYDEQYRNAYISYLFRPFLMNYSTYAKRLSDKILVAIPFMIDHILKFHAFAFSRQNLELLPEVISPNRTHLVRNLIFDLISYFSENHIKNIEMGLFEYRFNRKTSDELKFISKTFEEDSAAFNFSLDEMQSVKTYLQGRIENLRAIHSGSIREAGKERTIYSLSFLESLMGDAYYFDKEYDLAILSYLDSIQNLRYEENAVGTFENRISVLRLLLKIGLMYELMKKFDMALGYFYDALSYYKDNFSRNEKKYQPIQESINAVPMQLFFKALLSVKSLTEKKINNGLTLGNLEEFSNLVNTTIKPGSNAYLYSQNDDKNPRINLELAHYYTELGTILFHKNIIPIKSRNQIAASSNEPDTIRSGDLVSRIIFSNLPPDAMLGFKIYYESKDYRPTLASLGEYKRALLSMLSSSEEEKIRKKDPHFSPKSGRPFRKADELECARLSTLLYFAARKIKSYKNVYVSSYLHICANTFSSIGDSLFSLTVKEFSTPDYLLAYAKHYEFKVQVHNKVKRALSEYKKDGSSTKLKKFLKDLLEESGPPYEKGIHFSILIIKERVRIIRILRSGEPDKLEELLENYEPRPMKYWDDITYDYFGLIDNPDSKVPGSFKTPFCETQFIVFVYYLSARFFSKGGLNHNFSHLIKKIFQIVRNNLDRKDKQPVISEDMEKVVSFFENTLLKLVLESASRSSYSTDRPQMQKYKYFEGLNQIGNYQGNFVHHPKAFRRYNYFNLSNGPEVKEAILYFALLKLKTTQYPELNLSPHLSAKELSNPLKVFRRAKRDHDILYRYLNHEMPELKLINPYNVPSSQYSRLLEVDLHTRINYIIMKKIANQYKDIHSWESDLYFQLKRTPEQANISTRVRESRIHRGIYNFLCELVSSSIYLFVQQIKVYSIFQVNPLLNNTHLAKYHMRLGRWLKYYLILNCMNKVFYPEKKESLIDSKIDALFGNTFSKISLDTTSQFQIALQLLHKTKQYHSNGVAFKRDMENKVYLEGDYSDITYNFGLAVERHKVNAGKIRKEIRELEKELADSPLLTYESFTNSEMYPEYDK